jgi:S1-C subfamily serine protease
MKKILSNLCFGIFVIAVVSSIGYLVSLGLREFANPCQRIADASVTVVNADNTSGSGTIFEHQVTDSAGNPSRVLVLVTAHHVVENGNPKVTQDGQNYHPCHIVFRDKEHDIALGIISLDSHFHSKLRITLQDSYLGQLVYHCGSPMGVSCHNTLMSGMITFKDRLTFMGTLDQTSLPIHAGCSGGGVYDKYGDYMGFIIIKANEGLSCMAKTSTIYSELEEVGMTWLLTGKNCPAVEEINALMEKK